MKKIAKNANLFRVKINILSGNNSAISQENGGGFRYIKLNSNESYLSLFSKIKLLYFPSNKFIFIILTHSNINTFVFSLIEGSLTALGESHDYDLQLLDFKKEPIVRHNFESLGTYKEENGLSLNTTLFYLDLNKRIKSSLSGTTYNSSSKNDTSLKVASSTSSSKANSVVTKSTSNIVTRSSTTEKPLSKKRASSESSYCSSDSASSFTLQKKLVKKTNQRIENEKVKSSNSNEEKNKPQATVSSEILKIKAIESDKTNTNNTTAVKVEKVSEESEYLVTDDHSKNNTYSSYSNSNNYSSGYYRNNNSYYSQNGEIIQIIYNYTNLEFKQFKF